MGQIVLMLGFCRIFTSRRSSIRVCRIKWNLGSVDYPIFLQITIICMNKWNKVKIMCKYLQTNYPNFAGGV